MASVLAAMEQSALAQFAKSSSWAYPASNVGHILGLMVFFTSVCIMDLRLLGVFVETPAASLIASARSFAVAAFIVIALTGGLMFITEPASLGYNQTFLTKMALIFAALLNAMALEAVFSRQIRAAGRGTNFGAAVQISATLSIVFWICAAIAGRLIAYT
ncbi:MAG: hypothetical protein H7X92_14670 [Chitinophagales bacterium]|nr:hypothetical protein [Hyphomicrobiales bacterium]